MSLIEQLWVQFYCILFQKCHHVVTRYGYNDKHETGNMMEKVKVMITEKLVNNEFTDCKHPTHLQKKPHHHQQQQQPKKTKTKKKQNKPKQTNKNKQTNKQTKNQKTHNIISPPCFCNLNGIIKLVSEQLSVAF